MDVPLAAPARPPIQEGPPRPRPRPWAARRALALGLVALPGAAHADSDSDAGAGAAEQRRLTPRDPRDLCEVAQRNLDRAIAAVLRAPAPAAGRRASPPWDRRAAPLYLDRVDRRLALLRPERERLFGQGLVVPDRFVQEGYAQAFHEIYQSQLPVYVSIDAVFHALYASQDDLIADLEQRRLRPLLIQVLDALHRALASAAHPPEVAQDLALYLAVPRALLAAAPDKARDPQAAALLGLIHKAEALRPVDLFGRPRMVDFSQYQPRGHYTRGPELASFFRAVMWLTRLEFNLVSRSSRSSAPGAAPDPRETPREVAAALALADLAQRAGVLGDLDTLERALALIAGRREDVAPAQLLALRARAGLAGPLAADAATADRLRAAIGDGFQRTVNLHYMPQGTTALPVISTLLGARAVADAAALRPLVHDQVPERYLAGAADVAYLLGSERARAYLADDLRTFPTLDRQLQRAREQLQGAPPQADLYSAWLDAVRALAAPPAGAVPAFMQTPAFADLRLNSVITAYAQLRHNNVLFAGQSYEMGGCQIPDGYVEPAAAAYDALIRYAERAAVALAQLDPGDQSGGRAYHGRALRVLRALRAIVADELADRPLSVEARRFLSMVVEMTPGTTGAAPTYTGWYFDLFRSAEAALGKASFISDFHTSVNLGKVVYAGAGDPRLGLFVVDTGGRPRVVVGPVASAYQHVGPLAPRLTDEAARALPAVERERGAPWAGSYRVAAPPAPPGLSLGVRYEPGGTLTLTSPRAHPPVTIELLDHHRVPLLTTTAAVKAGETVLRLRPRKGTSVEALAVRSGDFRQLLFMNPVVEEISGSIGADE